MPKLVMRARRLAIPPLARLTVGLVTAGIVGLTLGYAVGPERHWLIALAAFVPYPAYLFAALTGLVASFWLGWPWRAAAVITVVLVVTRVMGLELPQRETGAPRLRVMTYNVKDYITTGQPGGIDALFREIDRHDPDVLLMQDARSLVGMHTYEPQRIDPKLRGREVFGFGQYLVASRFPLRDCAYGGIPFRDEPHTYVRCTVVAPGGDIDVVTAHFMTPRFGLNATRRNPLAGAREWATNVADRLTQGRKLAADLAARPRPTVVAGDLNSPPMSLVVRALTDTGLRDAFAVAGVGYGYTFGQSLRLRQSFLRIDHLLASREFGVADCFVGDGLPSAHRPVIADLILPGPAR